MRRPARQARARRRLRRRHPVAIRWRAAAPACSASISRPSRCKVAQLHALEAATPDVDYREVAAEALAAETPGAFDVVTCMEMLEHVPDPASIVRACARARQSRAAGSSSRRSTAIRRRSRSRSSAPSMCCKLLPKGTHEYAKFIRPSELAQWCRDAGLELVDTRGMEYNPMTRALLAEQRHQRQLPVRVPEAGMKAAPRSRPVLFDLDGTLIDSAPDLAGAGNELRVARGLPALPYERFRPMVGSGARGMVGVGLRARRPTTSDVRRRCATNSCAATKQRMTRETRVFDADPAAARCARRRAASLGHRHQQGDALRRAAWFARSACSRARGGARLRRHDAAFEAASGAAARGGHVASACEPARCIYVGDDLRDVQAGRAAGDGHRGRRLGLPRRWAMPIEAWGADHIIQCAGRDLLKLLAMA